MIRNIIFDLGGVIFDIRYQNVPEAFAKLGFPNFDQVYTQAAQSGPIDLFEEGNISVEEFRAYIRSISPVALTDQQIDDAWNSIIIDVPKERVEMLKEVKKHYRIFLFSNTNQLNYDKFTVQLRRKFGYDIFDELFEKAYFSHTMHLRKPDLKGFKQIIEEQHLNPGETLFIDDTVRHIEGAQKVGLHTYLLPKGEDLLEQRWL